MCRTCTTVYLLLVGNKIRKKLLIKRKTKCKDFIFGVMSRLVSELNPHCGQLLDSVVPESMLRIRIHRIHMFLGLPDPDPLVRGIDPDPDPAVDPDPEK